MNNHKESLRNLIRENGFSEITSLLGEIAKEEEAFIRESRDSDLASGFEMSFLAMMDIYPYAKIRQKEFIRQFVTGETFLRALGVLEWDSDKQSQAMKEARKTVLEWGE